MLRRRDKFRESWIKVSVSMLKSLASTRFLFLIVILYTVLGIVWIWVTNTLYSGMPVGAGAILVFISAFILTIALGVHTKAVYLKEQALMDSLALQETAASIDAELVAAGRMERVLAAVCAGVVNLGHQMCWVGLVKPDGSIEMVASHGLSLEYLKQYQVRWDETSLGMGAAGRAVRLKETCVFQDALNHPDFAPWREAAERSGYRAVAGVPIFGRQSVIGVVAVYNHRRNSFSRGDLFRLELLAQKASLAILASGQREALETLSRQHELLLDSVEEGIYGVDLDGRLTFINRAGARMLGYSQEELLGQEIHSIIHHTQCNDLPYPNEDCPLHQAITKGITFSSREETLWRKDGIPLSVEMSATVMKEEDEVLGAVMVFRDLTEIKRIKAQVANLSNYDLVTGVYNRRRFTEELRRALLHSRHFDTPGALLLLEIDSYKAINSTLGQTATEKLVIELVKLIKGQLKETDVMGSLAGDELGIILQGLTKEQSEAWANRLLEKIRKHEFRLNGDCLNITASIGVAYFDPEVKDAEHLLIQGENALFRAREQGYNRVQIYVNQGGTPTEAPWGWEYRLRRALEKNQFILQFQPLVNLQTYDLIGYEALIRLIGEDGQLIQPGVFMPWAERYGLIVEIDQWVLKTALGYLHKNANEQLKDKLLCINISGYTMADEEFKRIIQENIHKFENGLSSLVLEITETAAVANLAEARDFVNCVTQLGPRFSLDDFGAGFSSLNYLKHLPVEFLKIDGNFVQDLTSNPVDQQLVKFMIEVARGLNKKTVAERVEDEQTARLLHEYGVDYGQGYYFGRPGDYLWKRYRFGR